MTGRRSNRQQPARRISPHLATPQARSLRLAFTLIELMIVMVIIAILMGFLLVTGRGAIKSAQVTQVVVEIRNLEEAIARFEQEYGTQPPSFIVLFEQGGLASTPNWNNDGSSPMPNLQTDRLTSRARIRAIWPQFDFNTMGDASDNKVDLNGIGIAMGFDSGDRTGTRDNVVDNDVIVLNGAECLAFFLGGVFTRADLDGDGTMEWIPEGFSSDPEHPFSLGGSRKGPFADFDPSRFVDVDKDGFPEYLDSIPDQTTPLQYFSSYGGTGYLPRGLNDTYDGNPLSDDETLFISGVVSPVYEGGLQSHYIITDDGTGGPNSPPPSAHAPTDRAVYKPQGFQIISPGFDGQFGVGGEYTTEGRVTTMPDPTGLRAVNAPLEWDNITNFKGGELQ